MVDAIELALPLVEARRQFVAQRLALLKDIFLFEDFHHRQRGCAGGGAAGVSAAQGVGARGVHHLVGTDDGRDRHAVGHALGHGHHVRLDAAVLDGEHLAGAAKA